MDLDNDSYEDGDLYDDSGNDLQDLEDGSDDSDDEENFIMDAGFEDEPESGRSSQMLEEEYHFEVSNTRSEMEGQKSYFRSHFRS